jgi:hypothetical protein
VDVIAMDRTRKTIGASIADPSTTCEGGILTVSVNIPATLWDRHVHVGNVSPVGSRGLHVEHDGRSLDLGATEQNPAFRGTTLAGVWKLAAHLAEGEACGVQVPRSLAIEAETVCSQ